MSVAERRYAMVRDQCNDVLSRMTPQQKREWSVWAAKMRPCPKCKMGPGLSCVNLAKLKRNIHEAVKWPHHERIDFLRMRDGLQQRGYLEN
jgi:hypothetical protein